MVFHVMVQSTYTLLILCFLPVIGKLLKKLNDTAKASFPLKRDVEGILGK